MNSRNNECLAQSPAAARAFTRPPSVRGWLAAGVDRVLEWVERARYRRDLAKLDDRLLHDIGVSRYDAEHEANKPFWRA